MTAYRNFIVGFPVRCTEILTTFYDVAKANDREVTLMLAVAAAALIVPFERLRLSGRKKKPHASGDRDRPEFSKAKQCFENLLCQPFLGLALWPSDDPGSWQYGDVKKNRLTEDPDQWAPPDGESCVTDKLLCRKLLTTIRNALAHGNIWVTPLEGQISRLIFVSVPEDSQTANLAAATPEDFRVLLESWVRFLAANEIPMGAVEESEHFAAAA